MTLAFIGIFLGILAINLKRSNKKLKFNLHDNCLMTRHPLVFIPGRVSFFYFLKYWNNIPNYLKEHGYEVIEPRFGIGSLFMKKKYLLKYLNKLSKNHKKLHIAFDPSQIKEANFLAQQNLPFIKGIHLFSQKNLSSYVEKNVTNHFISDINEKITHSKDDYLKMVHDMFTQSPVFVPCELLGAKSNDDHLTVEPQYLKSIIKIAETDWHN